MMTPERLNEIAWLARERCPEDHAGIVKRSAELQLALTEAVERISELEQEQGGEFGRALTALLDERGVEAVRRGTAEVASTSVHRLPSGVVIDVRLQVRA